MRRVCCGGALAFMKFVACGGSDAQQMQPGPESGCPSVQLSRVPTYKGELRCHWNSRKYGAGKLTSPEM